MNEAYLRCLNCKAELGSHATSPTHARTMNSPWFSESFAWCYNCGWTTHYQKSRFRRWLVHKGTFIAGGFKPRSAMTLDDLVVKHSKFYSGEENYEELIWLISRSFLDRIIEKENKEERAWEIAKLKLPPAHLLTYCKVVYGEKKISSLLALKWCKDIKSTFYNEIEYKLHALLDENINGLEKFLNKYH
jgi:hypothetical protein